MVIQTRQLYACFEVMLRQLVKFYALRGNGLQS